MLNHHADRRVVFEDEYVVAVYRATSVRSSDCLVVTFASFHAVADGEGFGEEFLTKNGYDVLCFMRKSAHYYQDLQAETVAEIVNSIREQRHQRVCTYGASLGAYCAMYFAQACGASTAIAFSPRNSVDPLSINKGRRVVADRLIYPYRHQPLKDMLSPDIRYYVFWDPKEAVDAHYIRETVPKWRNMKRSRARYAGHFVIRFFLEIGVLKMTVLGLLTEKPRLPQLDYRKLRRRSVIYLYHLAQACREKNKHAWAAQLLQVCIALETSKGKLRTYYVDLADSLIRSNQLNAASRTMAFGARLVAREPVLREKLAQQREALQRKLDKRLAQAPKE